ncbi:hypothetical protein V8F06_002262 [Rhypophila decipiens]
MPLPQPKVPLTDICSTVFNNTLYTYSANAFQALPLESGGEWKQLPQGEKVSGGVCVGTTPGDPSTAALFVVGGKGSKSDYHGIQKYTYSTGKWESLSLPMPVTQERLWHGATYINTTDSLLIYAGSQDGSKNPSTQTFTIGANAPHAVTAYESIAPPSTNPILLQWSPSEAALIGGSVDNKKIFLFSPERMWFDSGASLADPIPKDVTAVKAIIMKGDDGSKSLYTFDMTESPNSVKRTVLFTNQYTPVQNAAPVASRSVENRGLEKREPLTINDWPPYDGSQAPMAVRNGFALAEDHDGMVVFAGGNEDDVLCMFNARENVWENATAMFATVGILSDESSSTTTATTLSTSRDFRATATGEPSAVVAAPATPTESSTAQPVAGGGPIISTNTILGAVLGAIFGLAILLFAIYWCIQRTRKRQAHAEAGHARRASGYSADEKDPAGYASDSMARSLNAPGVFRGHQNKGSHSSFSSMAILMGRVNQQKPGLASPRRQPSKNSFHSRNSSADSTFRAFKSTISKPIPQTTPTQNLTATRPPRPDFQLQPPPIPTGEDKGVSFAANTTEPRSRNLTGGGPMDGDDSTRRSSGWNRYWSGGSALNMLGFGGNNNGNAISNASRRETVESDGSHYSDRNRITQDSATVPPLQFSEPRASFSRVTTRSPTVAHHNENISQGMRVQIETQRPVSAVSSMSGYSSGIPASVHDAWDPTEASKPWGADRVPATRYNGTGPYTTPLAPASSTRAQPPPMRDDMSWLNLGDGR